jgi:hypothetical protein
MKNANISERQLSNVKADIFAALSERRQNQFRREGQCLYIHRISDTSFYIVAANLNAANSYWFDVYDDRLSTTTRPTMLAFGFGDADYFYTLESALNRPAFNHLKTAHRPDGRTYRQVYFDPRAHGEIIARDVSLRAALTKHPLLPLSSF